MDRLRPRSLRFRLTASATAVVALVLIITSIAVLSLQRWQLTANLDVSLEQRADTFAAALAADAVAFDTPSTPLSNDDEDRAWQLVSDDGRILTASSNLVSTATLDDPLTGDRLQVIRTTSNLPIDDDTFRVLSRRIETSSGPATLHVAENTDDLNEALNTLTVTLSAAVPLVVALLAALMWWLTGRTLGPVETIRAEVDAISATNIEKRLHEPDRDDEIGRLAGTMNQMLRRLDDAAKHQRRFVADAAHELRTPLTRIRTIIDVDIAQPEKANPATTNQSIREETVALQQLIDDLLHLASTDAGSNTRHREPLDLDDIVMREVHQLRTLHADLQFDTGAVSAAHLLGNPNNLTRAVRNLLTNSARHASSTVTVELAETNGHAHLAISDDGPGVPAEHQERIFERFTRADDARTRTDGGTGLGLAITRDIVENHGGSVRYDSSWQQGARFVVELPNAR